MAHYRMLIVNHAVEIGGAERVLLRLLDRLDRELFEPALACPHEGPLVEEMVKRGLPVHLGFPSARLLEIKRESLGGGWGGRLAYPWDMISTAVRLARLIRREGYHLVFTNSAKGDIYGSLGGWLAGRPVVWRLHDIATREAFSRLNLWLFRSFANLFARRVLAVSESVREAFIALGVRGDKVRVVYNGIDLEAAPREDRTSVRSRWGIPGDVPVAGMVGRLVDWKGPDCFVRAAARVAEEIPRAWFMLVGDAIFGERGYVDELKVLVEETGLADRTVFTGFREDATDIMACMDLLVHASVLPDPLPTVLIEAMSLGLPVVAAAGGGVGEIVEEGKTGLVVPPRDVEALAAAVVEILSRPSRATEMGEAGRRRVERRFEIGRTTRGMEEELKMVMEESAAGRPVKRRPDGNRPRARREG